MEAVIRQWPCGSLSDDTGQSHHHLSRSYFCLGAGNARNLFAGVSCSEGQDWHICVILIIRSYFCPGAEDARNIFAHIFGVSGQDWPLSPVSRPRRVLGICLPFGHFGTRLSCRLGRASLFEELLKVSSGKFARANLLEELLKVSSGKFVRADLLEGLCKFLRGNSLAFPATFCGSH